MGEPIASEACCMLDDPYDDSAVVRTVTQLNGIIVDCAHDVCELHGDAVSLPARFGKIAARLALDSPARIAAADSSHTRARHTLLAALEHDVSSRLQRHVLDDASLAHLLSSGARALPRLSSRISQSSLASRTPATSRSATSAPCPTESPPP